MTRTALVRTSPITGIVAAVGLSTPTVAQRRWAPGGQLGLPLSREDSGKKSCLPRCANDRPLRYQYRRSKPDSLPCTRTWPGL